MSSRFVRPVVVQIGRHDGERVIFDVNDAATILLRSFPHQTEKRKLAMDVCLQVLRGEAQTPVARGAFVAAALEAKILRSD
ncbi:hypothetical protein X743_27250 [Mesorhizobium sp. LNHC252B00]|uniref:DUF982 domain-containing protein n=1 Tax=Mesorhizobium sp. LNHC252B00 TaxID=1287252 RepID=UPI0003CE2819|nr:DUF982 domain-containing protein [Mesorhizobium sp. LNHC252B00]ESY67374.1 hypothetical protein X743_27250 [Mesorhizobium sp. LNHC252B00]